MMDRHLIRLQVFYEIAMTIGSHLDLHPMMKQCLVVYLRKLGCSSGMILRKIRDDSGMVSFRPALSIPRTAAQSAACKLALATIPDRMDNARASEWISGLPGIGPAGEYEYFHVMDLPRFGLMVLIKGGERFDLPTLKSLEQVNLKLAESCIACLQNERIGKINQQLSEEVLVRRATEARLTELTNELEQRVDERTRELLKKIDEIKETEDSLRESEERYRTVMEANPDPVVVYNMAGKVIFINPAFTTVFGWTFDEVAGRKLEFIPRAHQAETRAALEHVLAEGYVYGFESKRKTRHGKILDVSITAACYRGSDKAVLGVIVNLRDITELKKARSMMIQTEKMISVGGLAAGMAHEINNPLAGILQNVQVIENRLFKALPANERDARQCGISLDSLVRYLKKRDIHRLSRNIVVSGQRAARIVGDMLSFSRNEPGDFIRVRVDQIIGDALKLAGHDYDLRKKYDFRHLRIEEAYRDENAEIDCVPNQIQQVIFNILKNAAQAMSQSGDRRKDPGIRVRTSRSHASVIIEIEDNGPGMPKEVMNRVFEPFFTTKKVGEGTGLGLSVSYFIIKNRHKGEISVSSKIGTGTIFKIELPCQ